VPLFGGHRDPAVVYQVIDLKNLNPFPVLLRAFGFARLKGSAECGVRARYDSDLHALVAHNPARPEASKVFGATEAPSGFGTTFDYARAYERLHLTALKNSTRAEGDVIGCIQVDLRLGPGEERSFSFVSAVSSNGEQSAVTTYRDAHDPNQELERTLNHLEEVLSRSVVLTPDPVINEGACWSKVNMLRVMARYPEGLAFTNEPGVSSNVVGRDVAWFVYGNDHFDSDFSRALLEKFVALQLPNGKIPEFYSALDGSVEDYGLNINDDTPLFILAVNHHYRSTGDLDWLRRVYPAVARAARYIVSQEDDRGLVFCSARDPRGNVWAIASWRNVIPDYSINGAVTEINAECAAALRAAGHLTQNIGRPDNEASEFFDAGRQLESAISAHLVNPDNGLYYLNIDVDGNVHTDVTGDQIFPVLFRVAGEDIGFRVVSRLNSGDFWTEAGLRTASRNDPMYDPSRFSGLIGGVWPGLTWWYAFASARYHPEFMVKGLRTAFEHYGSDPAKNNTVPGQFSEWFDGESLVNRGMRLSPWEPPRFLWAAVEGVCGLMLTPGLPRVNPLIPPEWKWVGLYKLPYHGGSLTYFAARKGARFRIYSNAEIETQHDVERYDQDITERIRVLSASVAVVAFQRADEIAVLVGNSSASTAVVPIDLSEVVEDESQYDVKIYNSERGAWLEGHREAGETARSLAVTIEANGFRAVRLLKVNG
jgi:glycogen debranching enzyme